MNPTSGGFDRSYLPAADFEFVVLADTHHIVDPTMYPETGDSVTPALTRDWSARGDWALSRVAAINAPLIVHLGDLAQEYPGHVTFDRGRQAARDQLSRASLTIKFAPGNMDIGDKPDPTMPAGWVRAEDLARWHSEFGPSYYSFDQASMHFVIVNSQILNTALNEAAAQSEWLEADLGRHAGSRIVLFLHVPLYLVNEDEPGLGSYDVVDQPARSWLLNLVRRYKVEALFSAHIHFRVLNRVGPTRLFTLPSTTTTRPGFPEAFGVSPPSRGWSDLPKLGFFLVRVLSDGLAVHLIRTSGRIRGDAGSLEREVLTRTTRELPNSPLGANLRLPLAAKSDGAIAYPNLVRHRIRDDYPLLGCTELGLRHVRFPVHDLDEELQFSRLSVLRDEGVNLTAFTIWAEGASPHVKARRDIDFLEVDLAGRVLPTRAEAQQLAELRANNQAVALAPILMERNTTIHSRSRTGYAVAELGRVDDFLGEQNCLVDRAVCSIDGAVGSTWTQILAFKSARMRSIKALDFLVRLSTDDTANSLIVAEALLSAATIPNCRVFIDPLQELDRTAAVMGGLLDRLSNPRPAFHVARILNTVLFAHPLDQYSVLELMGLPTPHPHIPGIGNRRLEHWLLANKADPAASAAVSTRLSSLGRASATDLQSGGTIELTDLDLGGALRLCVGPMVVISAMSASVPSAVSSS